ncbi:MAG: phosphomannomutase [Cellvibrionales bacterium]|nr:phosphomannomutase [Cellvibrionales bacterium]
MCQHKSLFKAYDLRGRVPDELDAGLAYRIGRGYCQLYQPARVAVGFDIRNESPGLARALIAGLTDGGADAVNIGLCGTEEVYFAVFNGKLDGGIMVTASHNPKGYNGMKLVGPEARPISGETGLLRLRDLLIENEFSAVQGRGREIAQSNKSDYIAHLLSYIDLGELRPLKMVANPGNGGAGAMVKLLAAQLPFEFIYIHEKPDGDFPNGVPNPLLVENQATTAEAVRAHKADLGLAWDGDFDRCFFFDAQGDFIEGYYLVGLLAQTMLAQHPGATIVHDPRLTWNTIEQVGAAGGRAVQSRCGHAFIKQAMRERNALYGGEMSAHHYFRDFSYCDSGMIPWLLICALLSRSGQSLRELVAERVQAYPCSGEINFRVNEVAAVMERVLRRFERDATHIDRTDGIGMDFADWRFNLRASNTEPLLRLNVEARGDRSLMERQLAALVKLIEC